MILPLEDCLRLACYAEVLARKPGNVHPEARFDDLVYEDFLRSADAAAPHLARAAEIGVGRAIHDAVAATRQVVATNTNLGICLLLAPCAAASADQPFRKAIEVVLETLTVEDARSVYQAIRIAAPGGLGKAVEQDVKDAPTVTLRQAMQLAADRDAVAAQYANGFRDVNEIGVKALSTPLVPKLQLGNAPSRSSASRHVKRPSEMARDEAELRHEDEAQVAHPDFESAIIGAHLHFMAELPDTLIARKCGRDLALESARRAKAALEADSSCFDTRLRELDEWLRTDGHNRNPGTSADLVAASLFVAMRWGSIDSTLVSNWVESVMTRGRQQRLPRLWTTLLASANSLRLNRGPCG